MRILDISLALSVLALSPLTIAETKYETVTGWFLQDDASTDSSTFDFKQHNFGLKPQPAKSPSQSDWQYLTSTLKSLNSAAPAGEAYKLLFLGRHGQGYHNAAEEYYGPVAWFFMESKEGNGTVTWADAHLTPQGIDEASQNGAYWAQQLAIEGGVPAPNSYYVSPLFRCLQTANLTFGGLNLPSGAAPFVPTTKENVREVFGYATATRRSSKTVITNNFPSYKIEQGFTENDELWKPNVWNVELPWNTDKRVKFFLDELFTGGDTQGARTENMIVSVTSHAGTTDSFLRVIGHRSFPLGTAGVVPVFVKASGL